MSPFSVFKELVRYFMTRKKWWLAPIIVILLVFGGILVFVAANTWLAPVIYPLF